MHSQVVQFTHFLHTLLNFVPQKCTHVKSKRLDFYFYEKLEMLNTNLSKLIKDCRGTITQNFDSDHSSRDFEHHLKEHQKVLSRKFDSSQFVGDSTVDWYFKDFFDFIMDDSWKSFDSTPLQRLSQPSLNNKE